MPIIIASGADMARRDDLADVSDEAAGAVALSPERAYDLPAGALNGQASALNVPTSTGPAGMVLEDVFQSAQELIAAESPIEPGRQMEAGASWDEATRRRLAPLRPPVP